MNFHEWFVLTTSSPRRENYKELVKHYSAPMFYMAPWNWNEIAAAAMSIHLLPETRLAKLHDLYTKYGPVPRILLETFLTDSCDDINNAAVQRYDIALRIKITELLRDANAYIDNSFGTNDSHTILLMDLPLDDTYTTTCMEYENLAPTTFLRIATKYIGHLIGEAHGARASREAKILYDWSLGTTRTKGTAGWVFEMRIHSILQEGGSFSCSPLDSAAPGRPPSSPLRICLRKGDKTFTSAEGLGQLVRLKANARSVKPELCNIYLQPKKCNFTSRDSLAICRGPNNHITKIVFFQITVSQNHAVKAKGLDNVLEHLPADAKKEAPVIVFIVPASELTGFKRQKIDLGGSVINKHPAEKWHQYVLSFDDDKLWAAR
ncbi:hypothetical protein FN846DRAFT_915174 [Sphaerosporella brunnea]|uniref:Uncharacterized protein n=1 Tax=Sphaerosporella brunnea TaxID=1250544 RepID=A0A5J5ECV8_9PEZI|nr:hypothetical protein FN846DRAFT_915174 [Sphaerosporella brunnea]